MTTVYLCTANHGADQDIQYLLDNAVVHSSERLALAWLEKQAEEISAGMEEVGMEPYTGITRQTEWGGYWDTTGPWEFEVRKKSLGVEA